jgi:hypothetical protein
VSAGTEQDSGFDPVAAVEAWRASHAGAADPVQLHIVEALARRAAAQRGLARGWLVQRVRQRLEDLTLPTQAQGTQVPAPRAGAPRSRASLALLSELVNRLGRAPAVTQPGAEPSAAARRATMHWPLKSAAAFKDTWSRLRTDQRLRSARTQVPTNAGPLNSAHLVHQALLAMRELSPAYLDAFVAHIDMLLWLEQTGAGAEGAQVESRRRTPKKKSLG